MKHAPIFWSVVSLAILTGGCSGSPARQAAALLSCYDTGSGLQCIAVDAVDDAAMQPQDVNGDGKPDVFICADEDDRPSTTGVSDAGVSAEGSGDDADPGAGANDCADGDADSDSEGDSDSDPMSDDGDTDSDGDSDSDSDSDGGGVPGSIDCDCLTPPVSPPASPPSEPTPSAV